MQTLLIAAELMIAVALIVFVLLQRSEGGALGMGGGGSGLGGLFSPRGAADTLTRTTAIRGVLFFLVCIALNILARQGHTGPSVPGIVPNAPAATHPIVPAPVQPGLPSVPKPH